jgi:signal transduction histidine kinase
MAQRLAQLQEAIQRTERLRLLGQVSGGLAHQLRNGVAGARLAVQLFQRELAQGEQPDPSALEVALRQLSLVETNLKRFLDLGNRKPGEARPCSIPGLLGEAVALVQPQCRHARIDMRWRPPAEDITIVGDSGQLQQLFVNVISNAVEAAGPGGWVEVACRVHVGARSGDRAPTCVVEVRDSGPGPSPEVAARLFEPFVTGKPEGVGLGLAVARQVAESHDGHIAWSRDGSCTCFTIELGQRRRVPRPCETCWSGGESPPPPG